MEKQLITIIVTIFNVEKYLRRCIDSIITQTYKKLEIILVDDGSTDTSPQICDEYLTKDSRITIIHKKNGGAADARNTGLEIATGEFIGFVDGDDYILSNMYEILYNACVRSSVSIAMCGRIVSDERFKTKNYQFCMKTPTLFTAKEAIRSLLTSDKCDSASWDKLYRRNLFSEIKYPSGIEYDDLNVTARLIERAGKVCHVGEALYVYVKRTGSVTSLPFHKEYLEEIEQAEVLKEYIDKRYPDLRKQSLYFVCTNLDAVLFRAYECKKKELKEEKERVVCCSKAYLFDVLRCSWKISRKLFFLRNYIGLKVRMWRWKQ